MLICFGLLLMCDLCTADESVYSERWVSWTTEDLSVDCRCLLSAHRQDSVWRGPAVCQFICVELYSSLSCWCSYTLS